MRRNNRLTKDEKLFSSSGINDHMRHIVCLYASGFVYDRDWNREQTIDLDFTSK